MDYLSFRIVKGVRPGAESEVRGPKPEANGFGLSVVCSWLSVVVGWLWVVRSALSVLDCAQSVARGPQSVVRCKLQPAQGSLFPSSLGNGAGGGPIPTTDNQQPPKDQGRMATSH